MGLKLLTLSLCAVTKKRVKIHSTGEKARVRVIYDDRGMTFFLLFDNGKEEKVHWTPDLQVFVMGTDDIDEVDEILVPGN